MKRLQAYCVRRIIFSVIFVVLLCIVAGCGQANTATPATPSSAHIVQTPTVPTPTQTSSVLGHLLAEDGWDVTLVSAQFDDAYPIVENTTGERTAPNHSPDWLLVLHMHLKNISNQNGTISMGQYHLTIEPVGRTPLSTSLQYTPADHHKAMPLVPVPVGNTVDVDLVFSIVKGGGLTEHGTVTFDLNYMPYFSDANAPSDGWRIATFTAS